MVTADDVRAYAMTLPRTSEHLVYDQVKFRVLTLVDETVNSQPMSWTVAGEFSSTELKPVW